MNESQHPIRRSRRSSGWASRLSAAALLLTLTACGVVEMKVEPIVTATTAAEVLPPDPPQNQPGMDDDESMIIQTLAYPHLAFFENVTEIELFQQEKRTRRYMLMDIEKGFRLRADWRLLWVTGTYGVANITMDVYVKPPWAEEYEYWQYASTEDKEGWGPSFDDALLDATLYWTEPGQYQVRAELTAVARRDDGAETARKEIFDIEVAAFNSPSEAIPSSLEYIQPAFGEVEWSGVLVDWRQWAFGPCAVSVEDQSLTRLMDDACVAVESGDWASASNALQESLDLLTDDPFLLAQARGQLGVLASIQWEWNVAARHFREALGLWQAQNNPVNAGASLHNLGNALVQTGRWSEGEDELLHAAELRDQMGDYVGSSLSWAQLNLYWDSADGVEYMKDIFIEYQLPQADHLQAWLDAKQPPEEGEVTEE